jgi:hypothetical protein
MARSKTIRPDWKNDDAVELSGGGERRVGYADRRRWRVYIRRSAITVTG